MKNLTWICSITGECRVESMYGANEMNLRCDSDRDLDKMIKEVVLVKVTKSLRRAFETLMFGQ